jgi:hypothetical protein
MKNGSPPRGEWGGLGGAVAAVRQRKGGGGRRGCPARAAAVARQNRGEFTLFLPLFKRRIVISARWTVWTISLNVSKTHIPTDAVKGAAGSYKVRETTRNGTTQYHHKATLRYRTGTDPHRRPVKTHDGLQGDSDALEGFEQHAPVGPGRPVHAQANWHENGNFALYLEELPRARRGTSLSETARYRVDAIWQGCGVRGIPDIIRTSHR